MVKTVSTTALWSVGAAWLLAVAGVLAVALSPARDDYLGWIPLVAGVGVVLALALQVSTRTQKGFVARAALAVAGVLVAAAIGTLVLWLLRLAG